MEYVEKSSEIYFSNYENKPQEKALLECFLYTNKVDTDNILAKLADAYNYWLKVPEEQKIIIRTSVEMINDVAVILDDMYFDVGHTRGVTAVHRQFGIGHTLNSCLYTITVALDKCLSVNQSEVLNVYIDSLMECSRGDGELLYHHEICVCPTIEEYLEIKKKKAAILTMVWKLMESVSNSQKRNLTKLNEAVGLLVQIRNDFLNSHPKGYPEGVYICEEISQGKFTLPLVHGIQTNSQNSQLMAAMRLNSKNGVVQKYCASLLENYGSYNYTKIKIRQLKDEALQEIKKFGGNPYFEKLIYELCRDVV